jgi:hypothetical protein
MIRFSHSAHDKFLGCPREWQLHYEENLRSANTGSPLIFGTAIDEACENYLLNREPLSARETFKRLMEYQQINGIETHLPQCTQIEYRPADFDADLFLESDNKLLCESSVFTSTKEAYKHLQGKVDKTEDDKLLWNWLNWTSLRRKGKFLVNAFMDFVDEHVEEVLSTQAKIELEDEKGNAITGKADMVVKLRNHPHPVVLDLKTTTMYYDKNSVKESKQLALYTFYLREIHPGMKKAGYIVLNKTIKKNKQKICQKCGHDDTGKTTKTCTNLVDGARCGGNYDITLFPEASTQFILDEIPESMIESVIEEFNLTVKKVENREITQNWDNCVRFNGKIKCTYYEFCRTGCMDGLIKKEKKE